ncbi:MAG: hypothetical protein G01um101493_99 [Microgenomates group bacterium Gr01-1014_93]|nr:MAG: hypothetical protein G01um101493_99 [Microgenomates group bacterium Gr01-1014_93]
MEKEFKDKILAHLSRGWSAFPVTIQVSLAEDGVSVVKKPRFLNGEWASWQKRIMSPEEVDFSWMQFDHVGITTGKISGITVVDVDTKNIVLPADFPKTYTVESRKGYHYYFKYHPAVKQTQDSRDKDGKLLNIDIRNDGGFVFAPPTIYVLPDYTTSEYKVINDIPLAEFPIEWYQKTFNQEKSNWKEKMVAPVESGNRNMSFASIIGGLLKRFPMDEWESVVWPTVQDKNKLQEKPLSGSELRITFNSISKAETQARHQGGDIKDISTDYSNDELRVDVRLEQVVVCFKIKNIISSLGEANAIVWIQKATGLTHEIPFYLKIKSDSNKEQWVRILSKAFDKKENKETYPWTIIVAKVVATVESQIRTRQQDFTADTIEPKDCTWLLDPFIQEDMINTIFGMGSSGKTLLSLYFSKLVAETLGHNILFIDYEDTAGGWKNKLAKITQLTDFNLPMNKFIYFDSEQIPVAEQVDKIKDVIKKHNIKMVVVDSASLATGESTSDEKSAVRLVSALKLLRTTVLLIAHQRKNNGDETPIGSIQYENQSRNVWNAKGKEYIL